MRRRQSNPYVKNVLERKKKIEYIRQEIINVWQSIGTLCFDTFEELGIDKLAVAGGVASSLILNRMLRERLRNSGVRLFFAEPKLARDNAVGIALLTGDLFEN